MSAALVVARRELRERRFLMVTAAVAGALPLVVRLLPFPVARDVATLLAMFIGLSFMPAAALAVGASIVGRDAADGRLRFYFAQPLSASALWAGKFLAAVVLILVALLCTWLPAVLLRGGGVGARETLILLGGGLTVALCLMALAHVGSTIYRSPSPWRMADVACAALLLGFLVATLRPLLQVGAFFALADAAPWFMLATTAAALFAALAQLALGRADVRRGHAALSITWWVLAAALTAGVWAFGARLRSVSPADLGVGNPRWVASHGPALLVGTGQLRSWLPRRSSASRGDRASFAPFFVIDTETGRWAQVAPELTSVPAFDAAGRTAVWVAEPWVSWREPSLMVARLGGGAPRVEQHELVSGHAWTQVLALDRAAERAVVTAPRHIAVVSTSSGRVLASDSLVVQAAEFLEGGPLRLYAWDVGIGGGALVVLDWDHAARKRVEKLRVPVESEPSVLDHVRDLAVVRVASKLILLDAGRGTAVTVDASPKIRVPVRILENGTVAAGSPEALSVMTMMGQVLAVAKLTGTPTVILEDRPGSLVVGAFDPSVPEWWCTVWVDAATGRTLGVERSLIPAGGRGTSVPRAGSAGAQLFVDSRGSLIRRLSDGSRRVLVEPPE